MGNRGVWSNKNRHLLNVAKVTLLVSIVLYTGGYFIMRAMSKPPDRDELIGPRGKLAPSGFFYCGSCKKEFVAESGSLNPRCPDCMKRSTVMRIKKHCDDCGNDFVAASFDSASHKWSARTTKCPVCGSENLSDIHPGP